MRPDIQPPAEEEFFHIEDDISGKSEKLLCFCGKEASYKCATCWMQYCSKECQNANWSWHRHTCMPKEKPIVDVKDSPITQCYICKKMFYCICQNERRKSIKEKSCARNGYPKSTCIMANGGILLVHLCSYNCSRVQTKSTHAFLASRGVKTISLSYSSGCDGCGLDMDECICHYSD